MRQAREELLFNPIHFAAGLHFGLLDLSWLCWSAATERKALFAVPLMFRCLILATIDFAIALLKSKVAF